MAVMFIKCYATYNTMAPMCCMSDCIDVTIVILYGYVYVHLVTINSYEVKKL